MFENKKIAFIGPGMMAQAMIAGLVKNKMVTPEQVLVSGPRQERVEELQERYGVQPFTDNSAAAKDADVVVLSVKPQRLQTGQSLEVHEPRVADLGPAEFQFS